MEKINYYEALNINRELSTGEIKDSLDRLEATWQQRMVQTPEKAQEMIGYISEAKKIFDSEEARNAYDLALNGKDVEFGEDNENEKNREEFTKLLSSLDEYAQNKRYDLAKLVLEKILPLEEYDPDSNHAALYFHATNIYLEHNMYDQALELANRAIINNPDYAVNYDNKSKILYLYIDYLRTQAAPEVVLKYIDMYYYATEDYVKAANKEGADIWIAHALGYLSSACIYKGDIQKAEQCANQAIACSDQYSQMAKEQIRWIYEPYRETVDGFSHYSGEPDLYIDEIKKLISLILSYNPPMESFGLPLITKEKFRYQEEEKGSFNEEVREKWTDIYAISPNGDIVLQEEWDYERYRWFPGQPQSNYSDTDHEIKLSENYLWALEMELDYQIYYGDHFTHPDSVNGVNHWTSTVIDIRPIELSQSDNCLYRQTRKKGYGLYCYLKKLVDDIAAEAAAQAEYEAACKKINEEYETELKPLKDQIIQEYGDKRTSVSEEMNEEIAEAERNESVIKDLDNKIRAMESEYSKLGLFAWGRKKELEAEIKSAKEERHRIPAVSQVRDHYERQLATIDSEEERAITKLEQSVRARHPLPQKTDNDTGSSMPVQNSDNLNDDKDMNNEQIELIKSFDKMKSSSLYKLAKDAKEQCIQMGKTQEDIKKTIFNQLCMTAGYYGAKGPQDFPLNLDVFIYLRGKIEDSSSQLFQQYKVLFTKYDNYNFSELVKSISEALLDWKDPTDIAAITMFTAIQVITNSGNEEDKDILLMNLMQGTVIDNEKTNPDGVENSSLLWAFTAVYLDFENRLDQIVKQMVSEAANS